jgi:transposase, IS5 family
MRFCGLGPGDTVPDANTLWDFREALIAARALEKAFEMLDRPSARRAICPWAARSSMPRWWRAPKQRNTDGEKAAIKAGEIPRSLEGQACQAAPEGSRCPLDGEVRQGQAEGGRRAADRHCHPVLGYKSHISIDRRHGLIRREPDHRCGGP